MKQYLLPNGGQFFKANLHCHSILSDGRLTPQELKEKYQGMGYQILAMTDHEIMLPHQDLTDEHFLCLHGYEMEVNEEKEGEYANKRTCHMGLIALEKDNLRQVCWHPEKYVFANGLLHRHLVQFDPQSSPYERRYDPACISDMMKKGREGGFFVTYNHPTWSQEGSDRYLHYHHMHAMEICNFDCILEGQQEYNPRVYNDMLRNGEKIFCIAADDNHNRDDQLFGMSDSGGAWTMIKAENLQYRTVTKALEAGHFYASRGPEIHDLYVEDDFLHIATSPAREIMFSCGNRRARFFRSEDGRPVTHASYPLHADCIYVRVTVVDDRGMTADTNAYFMEDIL